MKIIFFGTSSFAARTLAFILGEGIEVVAVVTRPDRPQGRSLRLSPPPVKLLCAEHYPHLPIYQPEKASTPEFAETLRAHHADLFVVVAYGEIIKKNILEIPKLGCVNIHASLLPKYRGAAPIQRVLMNGEPQTGITIIEMTPQMDAGDILAIESIPISDDMTFGELEPALCDLGCKLIFEVIHQFKSGSVVRIPQDHSLATLAPKMMPQEEEIHWEDPAQKINCQIRAHSPYPGAWCKVSLGGQEKRMKIKRARLCWDRQGAPKEVLSSDPASWVVACGSGALELLEVQLEGKKTLSTREFLSGVRQQITFL